jgi:hypothetical protein
MPPPPPINLFVPPVTGVNGVPGAVVANWFDTTGNFRARSSSVKRRRNVDGSAEAAFDLTRDHPLNSYPQRCGVDVGAVRALLVEAASCVADVRGVMEDPAVDPANLKLAKFNIAIFNLLEAVVEKGIAPIAAAPLPVQENAGPPVVAGERELREALEAAEKTAVMFEADLGSLPLANRERLGHQFSAGIRAAAMRRAETGGKDPVEAVRLVADAVSCVTDIAFMGQASTRFSNKFNKDDARNGKFCTMPLKLSFPDRSSRIHFERVMRSECDLRASMSLPSQVREVQGDFNRKLRERYPDTPLSIRVNAEKLRLEVYTKVDGERSWTRSQDYCTLDPAIMLPGWVGVGAGRKAGNKAPAESQAGGTQPSQGDMEG